MKEKASFDLLMEDSFIQKAISETRKIASREQEEMNKELEKKGLICDAKAYAKYLARKIIYGNQ